MGSDNFPRKFGGDDDNRPLFDNTIPDYPRFCHCGKPAAIALVVVREKRGERNELVGAASEFTHVDKNGNPNDVLRDTYEFRGHMASCADCYLAQFPPPARKLIEKVEAEEAADETE